MTMPKTGHTSGDTHSEPGAPPPLSRTVPPGRPGDGTRSASAGTTFALGDGAGGPGDVPLPARIAEHYAPGPWVASGGQGKVMRGQQFGPNRAVAVKVIKKVDADDLVARERFHRELNTLGGLNSPYLVSIIEGGFDPNYGPVIVMEWVEGCSLRERLERAGRLEPREVVAVALDTAKGLRYLARQGIVHRDIKPGNIMIPSSGEPRAKIIDLGIARVLAANNELTATGTFVGTWKYGAPEQLALWDRIDTRADLYALGLVIHEMLIGRHAFGPIARKSQFAAVSLVPVRRFRADVPRPLCELVTALTAYDRDARPAITEVVRELETIARELF